MATKDEEEKKKVENVNGVTVTPKQPNDTERETVTSNANPTGSSTEAQPGTSVTGTSDPYEVAMNAHHQNGGGATEPAGGTAPEPSATPAPESTPAPTTTPAPEAESEPEPTAPADNGMPQRGTRFEDEARANAPKQYTEEELDDAKKRGKRESRMATAGHIMDTLARVFNYAATTQGAPSAKWSNHNREFDKNTYYDRMKKENEEARKNYFNMMLAGAGQDTKDYATALSGWREGNKEKREAELQPHKIAESQGKARKSEAEAAAKAIEAQYAPKEHEAKIKKLEEEAARARAQGNSALASAANSYALAEKHRGEAEKNRWYFMGNEYHSLDEYKKQVNKFWAEHQNDEDPISRTETLSGEGTDAFGFGKSTSKEVDKDIHLLAGELEDRYMKGSLAQGN